MTVQGPMAPVTVDTDASSVIGQLVHDLRSPVAAIEAAAWAVLQASDLDDSSRRLLDLIVHEARIVHGMVDEVLAATLVCAPRQRVAASDGPLEALLATVARRCSLGWDRPVLVQGPVSHVALGVPAGELQRALTNLIDNAFQHGCAASVVLEVELRAPWLLLRVRPEGLTFTEAQPRQGHGLGLHGVRRFARDHGVKLRVHGSGAHRVDELSLPCLATAARSS